MGVILEKLVPFRDWIYLGAFLLFCAGALYVHHHIVVTTQARDKADMLAQSDKLEKAAEAAIAQLTTQHAADTAKILGDLHVQQQTNRALAATDTERLRQFNAYRRAHPALASAASGPQPASSGAIGPAEIGGLFDSLEQVAVQLADANRDASAALKGCMADRDSLTGK